LSVNAGRQTCRRTEPQTDQATHLSAEMDHLSDSVLNGRGPLTAGAEGLADMGVMAATADAWRSAGAGKARRRSGGRQAEIRPPPASTRPSAPAQGARPAAQPSPRPSRRPA